MYGIEMLFLLTLFLYRSMDRVDESVINYDLIEDVLSILLLNDECPFTLPASFKLEKQSDNTHSTNGAVLIFMPGIGEIRTLIDRLVGMRSFGNSNKFEIIPLHSTLSSTDQKRAFKTSTIGCRKIIVSTNVAETSVTIPDVVYVLDCGRVREIRRNKRTSTKTLIATWCSRASAKQRAGRAGRVQSGICLKLYSSKTERTVMMQSSEPELKRIPLEEICLTILAGHFATDCLGFLSLTPEPPDDLAVNAALKVLEDIGAVVVDRTLSNTHLVSSAQVLTDLGRHLSKLPVDARVGKMLLFGAVFKCTDAVLTIAASLSASKSPFVNSFEDGPQAKAAHKPFYHPFSDFLTLVNVWKAFRQADQSGNARQFCREKYLNFAVLREIQDARYHFLDLLCGLGLISREVLGDCVGKVSLEQKLVTSDYCLYDSIEQVVHAVIYAGLNPNVASLSWGVRPDDLRAIHKNEQLIIQSSVNSKASRLAPSSWLTFFEKFGTEKRVTISTTAFVSPFCLLLFGSEVQVLHLERKVIVDNWIIVSLAAKTGIMIREIRNRLQNLLSSLFNESNMADPHRDDSVLEAIVKLLLKG